MVSFYSAKILGTPFISAEYQAKTFALADKRAFSQHFPSVVNVFLMVMICPGYLGFRTHFYILANSQVLEGMVFGAEVKRLVSKISNGGSENIVAIPLGVRNMFEE